jgi:selenocysteine lyase/cysteine desulfurase
VTTQVHEPVDHRFITGLPHSPDATAPPWLPELASAGFLVRTLEGRWVVQNNCDHGASAAAFVVVEDFVRELNKSACGVKRGDGLPSQEATEAYGDAREVARRFLGADEDTAIVFTHNATGATNIIAHVLNERAKTEHRRARVVVTRMEHHAMIVPFAVAEHIDLTVLPVPDTHDELLAMIDAELTRQPADLVGVTGASNVTGEIPDLAAIAAITEDKHGTPTLGDLAQFAAHHQVHMGKLGIKLAILSGHKFGAPYGVGVLACPRSFLEGVRPLITGGGVVDLVAADQEIKWVDDVEALHEPGSPPVVGALATAVAMAELRRANMDRIVARERMFLNLAYNLLTDVRDGIPELDVYMMWDRDHPKVGVITFNIAGFPWGLICAVLAGHFGIASRGGCFCAHPLMAHLLGLTLEEAKGIGRIHDDDMPGAVRLSFGYDVTTGKILKIDWALRGIVERGLDHWTKLYEPCGKGHWRPKNDTRPRRLKFKELTSW